MSINDYTPHQANGLAELIAFRPAFSLIETDKLNHIPSKKKKSQPAKEITDSFTEKFCQYDFADTNYDILQTGPPEIETMHQWIEEINLTTVLQFFTYIIWTDRIEDGYFFRKIKDKTVEKLLSRLDVLINEGKENSALKK
jgi:hypothetical protein